ncbi:hypothetical protein OK074_0073 [Actinobacteria bacterium OK074]|nr:hypothetical protein OK074_0073 [Actinobacteria bacterium OK074]
MVTMLSRAGRHRRLRRGSGPIAPAQCAAGVARKPVEDEVPWPEAGVHGQLVLSALAADYRYARRSDEDARMPRQVRTPGAALKPLLGARCENEPAGVGDSLLVHASEMDDRHGELYQRTAPAESLRKRVRSGAKKPRRLVARVRASHNGKVGGRESGVPRTRLFSVLDLALWGPIEAPFRAAGAIAPPESFRGRAHRWCTGWVGNSSGVRDGRLVVSARDATETHGPGRRRTVVVRFVIAGVAVHSSDVHQRESCVAGGWPGRGRP